MVLWTQLQEQRATIADLSNALRGVQELLQHGQVPIDPMSVTASTTLARAEASLNNTLNTTLPPGYSFRQSGPPATESTPNLYQNGQVSNAEAYALRQKLQAEQDREQIDRLDRSIERERLRLELGLASNNITKASSPGPPEIIDGAMKTASAISHEQRSNDYSQYLKEDVTFNENTVGSSDLDSLKSELAQQTQKLEQMRRRLGREPAKQ